jgi:membrane-associated phospholipid phosphatase
MHWLQSLDTALFHFVNGALSNPFFDWLMPVLSGRGVPWLIAVVIAVPIIILFGSVRLRLCALFAVLIVALGDPLIVGTIRQAIGRHRPCIDLSDTIERLGCTGTGSMPSAHAANSFAIAMLLFLFYRRTAWFMFPLAAGVAFSRVYCGVHYPSDVTVGALLGAGYAIVFVVLSQHLWNFIGPRLFAAWHAQLPNLLKPEDSPPQSAIGNRQSAISWLRLGYVLIGAALIGRWIYLGSGIIGLSGDEAYQWLWSKHPALSYYSKPPGIAYIQWAGTFLFGDNDFGVRFFSPVFAAILSVLVLRFMAREAGPFAAFCLLLITFATPLLVVGSILMTVDPPLVLCWMWAVIAGWRAVQPAGTTRDWLIVGLALGLGFLCKYTALAQIICWAIFFALQPSARIHLKKPGPWLGLLLFGICTLPVIIWNTQHHWITLSDLAGDAGLHHQNEHLTVMDHVLKSLNYFGDFTGGECGLLNPIFLVGALWAMVVAWKRRAEKPLWFFLLCLSAPLFCGYWLWSFHSRAQLNWIAAAVPPMFCLMVMVWSGSQWRIRPWVAAGVVLGIAASVFMYDSDLLGRLARNKLPGDVDPTHLHFLRGGRETAQLVEAERLKFDPNAFILADHYSSTGIYSFYSAPARTAAASSKPLVYCLDSDKIIDQFPFWDAYNYTKHCRGRNALFVMRLDPYKLEAGWLWKWLCREPIKYREIPKPPPARRVESEFESVTNLGVYEIKLRDGRVFQRVELLGCYHLK